MEQGKRQICLDTETTGFDYDQGHRIIEFGAIELVDRKRTYQDLHLYFKPDIAIEPKAQEVHGITEVFLVDKPTFESCVDQIMNYLKGAELIIHNARFDVPFLNHELSRLLVNQWGQIEDYCTVVDTLTMARKKHPGQKNNLDALCKRYQINNTHRTVHGALLDAGLLADVYLQMTGGQIGLELNAEEGQSTKDLPYELGQQVLAQKKDWKDQLVNDWNVQKQQSDQAHQDYLKKIAKASGKASLWSKLVD